MRADQLKRGDRIWIGGVGWRAIQSVRRTERAEWIDHGPGPAIALRWHGGRQDVRPETNVVTQAENHHG